MQSVIFEVDYQNSLFQHCVSWRHMVISRAGAAALTCPNPALHSSSYSQSSTEWDRGALQFSQRHGKFVLLGQPSSMYMYIGPTRTSFSILLTLNLNSSLLESYKGFCGGRGHWAMPCWLYRLVLITTLSFWDKVPWPLPGLFLWMPQLSMSVPGAT